MVSSRIPDPSSSVETPNMSQSISEYPQLIPEDIFVNIQYVQGHFVNRLPQIYLWKWDAKIYSSVQKTRSLTRNSSSDSP